MLRLFQALLGIGLLTFIGLGVFVDLDSREQPIVEIANGIQVGDFSTGLAIFNQGTSGPYWSVSPYTDTTLNEAGLRQPVETYPPQPKTIPFLTLPRLTAIVQEYHSLPTDLQVNSMQRGATYSAKVDNQTVIFTKKMNTAVTTEKLSFVHVVPLSKQAGVRTSSSSAWYIASESARLRKLDYVWKDQPISTISGRMRLTTSQIEIREPVWSVPIMLELNENQYAWFNGETGAIEIFEPLFNGNAQDGLELKFSVGESYDQ